MSTHDDGIAAARALAVEFEIEWHELRWFASVHLQEVHPDLDEVGSSDVSIHLSSMALHDMGLLREEAERLRDRNNLVRRMAASSGKSEEETLHSLQALFAPSQD